MKVPSFINFVRYPRMRRVVLLLIIHKLTASVNDLIVHFMICYVPFHLSRNVNGLTPVAGCFCIQYYSSPVNWHDPGFFDVWTETTTGGGFVIGVKSDNKDDVAMEEWGIKSH